jgi:hypothetical protein
MRRASSSPDERAVGAVSTEPPPGDAQRREAVLLWLHNNANVIDRFAGSWLAIGQSGVIATGRTLADVRAASTDAGYPQAEVLVFKVPATSVKKVVSFRRA